MPRRTTLLPALAALVSLGLATPAVASPAPAPARRPRAVRAADAPLSLTIDTLTPSSIPQNGKVLVSGWVTNNSDETWTAVNVHAFIGADPITTSSDLAFESTRGVEESVGDRITVPGTFDTIPELAPGASASYTDRIPVSLLGADEPGVYWFGVHALGTNTAGRDVVADGRARTFLPYVPAQDRGAPIPTALVLPVRHQVLHDPDGTLGDEEGWLDTLGDGGQLSSILDFGLAAGGRPLTWLVDPAVPDSASRIAAGNPPRELVVREAARRGHGGGAADRRGDRRDGTPGARTVRGAGRRRGGVAGQAQPGGVRQAGPGPALGRRRRRRSGQARHRRSTPTPAPARARCSTSARPR